MVRTSFFHRIMKDIFPPVWMMVAYASKLVPIFASTDRPGEPNDNDGKVQGVTTTKEVATA